MGFREVPWDSIRFRNVLWPSVCFHCLPLGSIDFPLGSALILSYLISSYLLILSYLFLVFCFPARFWCWDICDGFKYPRGYPHVRQRIPRKIRGRGSLHGGSRLGRSCCGSSEEPIDHQKSSCGGRTPTRAPGSGSPELWVVGALSRSAVRYQKYDDFW